VYKFVNANRRKFSGYSTTEGRTCS